MKTQMEELEEGARRRLGAVVGGRWTLERLLGVGAMGAVYRGVHTNGHKVAIKVLHAHLVHRPKLVMRLRREGRLANQVNHPSVVRVLDDGVTDDGAPFLVSDLVEGETLEQARTANGGSLALEEVKRLGRHLLGVLEAAHAAGVVHRDIKPANLMLLSSGDFRVLDFGLGAVSDGVGDAGLTSVDSVLGTVGFMAPEQASGRWDLVDERTDIWAVGATLLKLATGLDAHEATTAQERLAFAATRPVAPTGLRAPSLPGWFAAVLDKAMAFAKRDRFSSAREMCAALDGIAVSRAAPLSSEHRNPKAVRGLWVLLATAVVLATGFVAIRNRHRSTPPLSMEAVSAASGAGAESVLTETTTSAPARAPDVAAPVPEGVRSAPSPVRSTRAKGASPSVAASKPTPLPLPDPQRLALPSAATSVQPIADPLDRRR